jgi:hypothetical protein
MNGWGNMKKEEGLKVDLKLVITLVVGLFSVVAGYVVASNEKAAERAKIEVRVGVIEKTIDNLPKAITSLEKAVLSLDLTIGFILQNGVTVSGESKKEKVWERNPVLLQRDNNTH